jgi:hypothetical protein
MSDVMHVQPAMGGVGERQATRQRFRGAIWTLLLLAPFISEVLSGATRTSVLFVFLPEVMVWGVGALLSRELVRRWRAGGVSLLLLGLALSVAEEFIIQQTSLAPLPFPGSHPEYGRMWGVNLVWLLFMLGFESVWVVVVPVKLTELCFAKVADRPWLRRRGIIVSCVVFLLGCRIAWYAWTQRARPALHAAPYHPPAGLLALGFALIAALIGGAYLARRVGVGTADIPRGMVPAWVSRLTAWVAGLTAFVMGVAWENLIAQNFIPKPVEPFWIMVVAGVVWAAVAFVLFVRWSSRRRAWGEVHLFAAALGTTLACMAAPYLSIAWWPRIDVIGIMIFDALAAIGFVVLGKKVLARARTVAEREAMGRATPPM